MLSWNHARILGLVLVLAVGCNGNSLFAPDASWKEFRHENGRFTVLFPGTPKEDTQSAPTAIGPIAVHFFTVESPEGMMAVAYSDFPAELIRRGNVDKMLDGARDGAVANVGGKLVEEKKAGLWDAPGRELLVKVKDSAFCRCRLYLVKNRLYQVHVLGNRERVESPEADKFFNSFEFHREGQPAR